MERSCLHVVLLATAFGVSGCAGGLSTERSASDGAGKPGLFSRFGRGAAEEAPASAIDTPPEVTRAATPVPADASFADPKESEIIQGLLLRRSILPASGPYAQVSNSVLLASARAAEADLRAARLRERAASKNWLPKIGPSISLTSLSDIVSGILVEQVIFANGRLKAEREYAAADVEAAAVNLSEDVNDRVLAGLTLYLRAAQAREAAEVSASLARRMRHFHGMMQERVNGGVSDMSDLRIIAAKLREAEDAVLSDQEAAATALAELNAMADRDLSGVRGVQDVGAVPSGLAPLAVLEAQAIRTRNIAQAKIDRAELLPTLSVGGDITGGDITGLIGGGEMIGVGTGAAMQALKAAQDAADRRVVEAQEDAAREMRRMSQQIAALDRQEAQKRQLAADARANHALFQEQFENGGRSILDVIGVYETAMRLEHEHVQVKYDRARVKLEMADLHGALVDGGRI
ncbi:MAG: TolC family protein [Shimia sp.]